MAMSWRRVKEERTMDLRERRLHDRRASLIVLGGSFRPYARR